MAQTVYETLFLLDSNRFARDPGGSSKSLTDMVEQLDGKILASRLWNEQKLAYPIEGHQKGTYWLIYHELESTRVPELNRAAQLNDVVLRQLTLKIDPRLVGPMVAHARGERLPEEGEGEGEAEGSAERETVGATSES